MKTALKKVLLESADPIPEYTAIGLEEPQALIRVFLHGLGEPLDVTENCVVAGLRPFTLAISFGDRYPAEALEQNSLSLVIQESPPSDRVMGGIELAFSHIVEVAGQRLHFYQTVKHHNYCLSPIKLRLHYLYRERERKQHPNPYNFVMTPEDLLCHYVFYICPRPVVLVTAVYEQSSNIFPMDLLGPTASGYFLLALRSTSPAVRLMSESKRIVISYIPIEYRDIAYELGKHHKKESINWDDLPFKTMASPTFGVPIPTEALAVRELVVEQVRIEGLHTLFITRPVHEQTFRDGRRMFHIQGLYELYLKKHKRALVVA